MFAWLARNALVGAPALLLSVVLLNLLATSLAARWAARRRRRRLLRELGEPRGGDLRGCTLGEQLTLEGVLECDDALPGLSDGKPVAAVSIALAPAPFRIADVALLASYRAEAVWLRIGDARIALRGAIEVVGGEQWWPCAERLPRAAAARLPSTALAFEMRKQHLRRSVVQSLAPGLRVRLRGRVVADDEEEAAYREHGGGRAIENVVAVGVEGSRPRAPLSGMLRSRLLLAMAAMVLAGYGWLMLHVGNAAELCELRCSVEGACQLISRDLLDVTFTCGAVTREDCLRSSGCQLQGRCTRDANGRCVVADDADCASSAGCREKGACSRTTSSPPDVAGRCVLIDDDDCQQTRGCKEQGRCSRFEGECVKDLAAACAEAKGCRMEGKCTVNPATHECEVGSDPDCADSELCLQQGRCTARADAGQMRCVAGTDADCAASTDCLRKGTCTLVRGWCAVASKQDCQSLCKSHGLCQASVAGSDTRLRPGSCNAATDEDCEGSEICTKFQHCYARGMQCVDEGSAKAADGARPPAPPDCRRTDKCVQRGYCTAKGGSCVVGSDDDCKLTLTCKQEGKCSLVNGLCGAATDDDCRASEACSMFNRCFANGGSCVDAPPPDE